MSLDLRWNRVVQSAVLALACSVGFACGDDTEVSPPAVDAGTRDRDAEAPKAGKGGGSAQDDRQSVTINFRAAVADRDFSCLERYENVGSTKTSARPVDFRFYVQDLALIDADGEEVPVALETRAPWQTEDVALIDFEDMKGSCKGTPETNITITGKVPAGEYTGVVFTNGVPEALNHLDQSQQPPPLDVTELYWAWLSGYRFMVAELAQDGEPAPAADEDAGVVQPGVGLMHIGSTSCRKDRGCTKKNRNRVRLTDFKPDSDVIVADMAAIFGDTDVAQDMQCHSADEICAPMFERLGVDFATGESNDAQKVFRVGAGGAGR
jgi:uncharacterized repeat protein (TIGR04052 family)